MAGADFTRYHSPGFQTFVDQSHETTVTDMQNNSKQDISQGALFINHSHTFETGWALNYGVHGGFTSSKTYIDYLYNKGNGYELALDELENNRQKEYSGNAFLEVSKDFGSHFSATASLKVEYFKSDYTSNGMKSTLWNDWTLFPNATLSYTVNPMHIIQLDISSDKTYPSYWMTTPTTYYMNVYSSIIGNPDLKPQLSYSMQLNYVLKSKYVFGLFTNIQPDKIQQMTYQRHDELRSVFQTVNMDIYNMYGAVAVIPFRPFDFMSSRLTLMGCAIHNKGTLYDVFFDRKKLFGRAELNNTFYLTEDRNLLLELRGYCISPVIQGLYDVDLIYNVSAGLTWTFAKKKMRLTVRGNDLFEGGNPVTRVDEQGQKSRMKLWQDSRNVTLTLRYSFGGYKEKKAKEVDTSRLGTGI